ncbi:hypothetical protein EJB05_22088, partial [Eragrostis curvula]
DFSYRGLVRPNRLVRPNPTGNDLPVAQAGGALRTGNCRIYIQPAIYTQDDRSRSAFPTISVPAPPPEGKQETLVLHWFALFPSLGTLGEDRTNQVSSWLNFPPLLSLKDPRRGSSLLVI